MSKLAGIAMGLLGLLPVGLQAQSQARLTQVVERAAAPVAWAAPASIGYGTPLDGTQLDASSPVAGRFVYVPEAGAILPAGQQTLTTEFEPADSNYKATEARVALTVRPAAGATFQMGSAKMVGGTAVLRPGVPLTILLTPMGDFHQPVTLACTATGGYSCSLDRAVMRPTTVALPLRVVVTESEGAPGKVPVGPLQGLMVVMLVVGRKRLRRAGMMAVLLGLVGCGLGGSRPGVATISGSSLLETKTLQIPIVAAR